MLFYPNYPILENTFYKPKLKELRCYIHPQYLISVTCQEDGEKGQQGGPPGAADSTPSVPQEALGRPTGAPAFRNVILGREGLNVRVQRGQEGEDWKITEGRIHVHSSPPATTTVHQLL